MASKSFEEVSGRFSEIQFKEKFDIIVAVANGGIIPAAIINQRLGLPFYLLKINLRDSSHKLLYEKPKLLEELDFDFKDKKILLVEDRIKTGSSINYARELLKGAKMIKTFAVNGAADYFLYNESCFPFPWIIQ